MLTGRQIREGRELVKWSPEQLAKRAEIAQATILRAERYDAEAPITIAQEQAIRRALEGRGVTFAPVDRDVPAVKLRRVEDRTRTAEVVRETIAIGYTNRRNQTVLRKTDLPGTNYRQTIYVLRCNDCGYEYGSNGSEICRRRCPRHDGGKPGPEI